MTRVGVKSVLLIWALAATLLAGYLAASLENRYLDHHPYFFDAVSYSFYNAKLYQRIQEVGRVEVAYAELANNNRFPLRTVPLVLFAPSMLAHPFGHMVTALPPLFFFIFLLAYTCYLRAKRVIPALAVSSVAILLPGFYNPVTGIAVYWLDLTAALFVGAAILSLLNSNRGQNLRWLILFVVFSACAAYARYISIAYLLFACVPVIIWFSVTCLREKGDCSRSFLMKGLIVSIVGVLLVGPYLIAHAGSVIEFYRLYGYALGASLHVSLKSFQTSFVNFVGISGLCVVVFLVGLSLLLALRQKKHYGDLLLSVWLALAIPIFLVLVLKTSAIHTISYAVIVLSIALAIPWAILTRDGADLSKWVSIVMIIIVSAGWGSYYRSEWRKSSNPTIEAAEGKKLQTKIADQLARYGPKVVWNAYFDEISWIPSLDAFYRHGVLPLPLGQDYVFSIHESVYRGNYPGWESAQIHEELLKNANTYLDIAAVFDEPGDADKYLPNEFSRKAAKYLAISLKNDSHWQKESKIYTDKYGRLAIYRNLNVLPDIYRKVLAGQVDLRPHEKVK